jgi:hypothetical protein
MGLVKLLEQIDVGYAEATRQEGCLECRGKLHRADYPRKPRGFVAHWTKRFSFCCAQEGCRQRRTPPSVRFLGRRVYPGVVVVLVSALAQGINARRAQIVRRQLGIDEHTLRRWREWWLEHFVQSPFWKVWKARFRQPVAEARLPLSLVERLGAQREMGLVKLMQALRPISIGSLEWTWGGK